MADAQAVNPRHVAVIMDGNRRWAERQGLSVLQGHQAGLEALLRILEVGARLPLHELTVFGFSRENWQRPAEEVIHLFDLLLDALHQKTHVLATHDIRLSFIGDVGESSDVPVRVQQAIQQVCQHTAHRNGMHLRVAINYSGQWDVVQAARALAQRVQAGTLRPEAIDTHTVNKTLQLQDAGPVDLLIRTSGEQRLSNFLLWHLAYTELHFTPVLWPDFSEAHFQEAVALFRSRERRYGRRAHAVDRVQVHA